MQRVKKLFNTLADPFRCGERFESGLAFVFVLINGIVFINACLHDPRIGYDAHAHLNYIQTFSHLRLVTPQDSYEFFSPPLPYVIPSLFIAFTGMKVFWAAKLAQFINVILSIGLTWCLIKICHLLSSRSSLKYGTLVFLGILPVYYKTFAFVRGEPYVAFFAVATLYYVLFMVTKERYTALNTTILGVTMGLCALSRQWGIFLFPSVFLLLGIQWMRLPRLRRSLTKSALWSLTCIAVISGWFYFSLYRRYDSFTAFNRKPAPNFSFTNEPAGFYVGVSPQLLFSNPVRPNFSNQFFPIFYSEMWGDYWGYFTVYGRDTRKAEFVNGRTLNQFFSKGIRPYWLETNYDTIGAYLGRVNLVSIFPSILAVISLAIAARDVLQWRVNPPVIARQRAICAFLLLSITTTMAGYFWFCIMYPSMGKGDTIKAAYVLQIFPFLAILVAIFLEQVEKRSPFVYRLIFGGLCCSFVHNIFAMVTHYNLYRLLGRI